MRGRGDHVKVRDDVVVGVADPQLRGDREGGHRPEGILAPVGRAELEALAVERVERDVNRGRGPEGGLDHREGLELPLARELEDVAPREEVVHLLAAVLHPVVVEVLRLEHVRDREGKVIPVGVVEHPRADVQERLVGVGALEGAVVDVREGRVDRPEVDLVHRHARLHAEGKAVLPAQSQRVGEVAVDVGLLDRADPVVDQREAKAHVAPNGAVQEERARGRGVLDLHPLLAV